MSDKSGKQKETALIEKEKFIESSVCSEAIRVQNKHALKQINQLVHEEVSKKASNQKHIKSMFIRRLFRRNAFTRTFFTFFSFPFLAVWLMFFFFLYAQFSSSPANHCIFFCSASNSQTPSFSLVLRETKIQPPKARPASVTSKLSIHDSGSDPILKADETITVKGARNDTRLTNGSEFGHLWKYWRKGADLRRKFHCQKLFQGDKSEQTKVLRYLNKTRGVHGYGTISPDDAVKLTSNCHAFRTILRYDSSAGRKEEADFPIAYVILAHIDFEHVERLLRALYRPWNVFCIHLDAKASPALRQAVTGLAKCLPNVRMASVAYEVVYAHVTRLWADLVCMRDLVKHDTSWRYLINTAATELPLRSNWEVVKILQSLGGLNDIREVFKGRRTNRYDVEFVVKRGKMSRTEIPKLPAPHNLTVIKGQAYNTFSRAFLEWAFTDQRAADLLTWSNGTHSPDEHYWGTLNNLYHNGFLQAPGGFTGHPDKKGYITMYVNWGPKCQGMSIHRICITSVLDLPTLPDLNHLFLNKFDLSYDPVAYACTEELLEKRNRGEFPFDVRTYEKLHFVSFMKKQNYKGRLQRTGEKSEKNDQSQNLKKERKKEKEQKGGPKINGLNRSND